VNSLYVPTRGSDVDMPTEISAIRQTFSPIKQLSSAYHVPMSPYRQSRFERYPNHGVLRKFEQLQALAASYSSIHT
jgi:hypothetical protein